MGWTSMSEHHLGGRKAEHIRAFFKEEWETGNHYELLDFSKKGNTVYMAIKKVATNEVFAAVSLIGFENGEFYYKDMDETVGPAERECPQRILKLLTPTDNNYAKAWREDCWNYHSKKRSLKNKYEHGAILEFDHEISFTDGYKGKKFILIKQGRKTLFAIYRGQTDMDRVYAQYRITAWRKSEPKVIGYVGKDQVEIVEKTMFVSQLSEKIQKEIKKDLKFVGIEGIDLDNALNSRLGDLEEVINLQNYIN